MKLLLALLVLVTFTVSAQSLDELKQKLKRTKNDSIAFELQNQIFQRAIFQNIDSSFACLLAQKKLLAKNTFIPKTLAKFRIDHYVNTGVFYNRKGKGSSAIQNYESAYNIAVKDGFKKEAGTILNNIANIHYQNGDYHIAQDYHLRSLRIRKDVNDTLGIGMSLGNLGLIFEIQQDHEKAIQYYKRAQGFFKMAGKKQSVAWTYRVIGTAQMEMKNFSAAKANLQKSMRLCESLSDHSGKMYCLLNLGVVHNDLYLETYASRFLDSSEYYLDQLENELQDQRIRINYLNYKSRVLVYRKNFSEALKLLALAEQLLMKSDMKSEQKDVFELYSMAYSGIGDFKSAFDYHSKFKKLSDEIFSVEKDQEMGRKQATFEYEEKLHLEKIKRENQRTVYEYEAYLQTLIIIIIGLCFVIALIVFTFIYRRKARITAQLKKEKDQILKKYESLEKAYNSVLENLEKLSGDEKTKKELPEWAGQLSKRELEVLSCLAIGMSDNEIQEKLFISVATVRTHCQRIYGKLLVKNRMEASNLVREYGLI